MRKSHPRPALPIRHLARLLGVATALGLAACSHIPSYERPAAPVAATFGADISSSTATAAAISAVSASDLAWQVFFQDARLHRLIEIALQNNRDLRIAALTIEQTRAQLQLRRADELPAVSAGVTASRGASSTSGAVSSSFTAGVSVTAYELDLFGRVRALSEAAQAQLLGSEEARKTVQIALVSALASSYLNLLADDALLRITRDTVASREASLQLTRLKYDREVASKLDLVQSQSLLEAAKVALAQLTRQRAQDENALSLLLGQPLPNDLPAGRGLLKQGLLATLPAGIPSEVLAQRPDVRVAEQQLIANNANIGAARAAFFPRISLTGSAGVVSTDLEGLFSNGTAAWTFVPQLLLPIFDAGRNQANLEVARVAREIALAQYEKSIQTGFREVADALAGRATLTEQLRAQSAQLEAEKVRLELVKLRFDHGAASSFDLLDSQRSLYAAQQALVQIQVQQLLNLVTLYKVLGGGWKRE